MANELVEIEVLNDDELSNEQVEACIGLFREHGLVPSELGAMPTAEEVGVIVTGLMATAKAGEAIAQVLKDAMLSFTRGVVVDVDVHGKVRISSRRRVPRGQVLVVGPHGEIGRFAWSDSKSSEDFANQISMALTPKAIPGV